MSELTRHKSTLWKEITIALVIKAILIFVIWKMCFSDPVKKHLTTERVQDQFFAKSRSLVLDKSELTLHP